MHEIFFEKISQWFVIDSMIPKVVITHHAPVTNPNTQYSDSPLSPAFNSLDMMALIDKYQPNFWVYGHTHECDSHFRGETQVVSNQLGYPKHGGGYECLGFEPCGLPITFNGGV